MRGAVWVRIKGVVAIAAIAVAALAGGRALAFDGELDPDFDGPAGTGNGKFTLAPTGQHDQGQAVAVQSDGKIVVAGFVDSDPGAGVDEDFEVMRFNPNGTLDAGFDGDSGTGNGIVTTKVAGTDEDQALAVALAPDGDIIAAGYADTNPTAAFDYDFALTRYQSADGELDTGFGGGDGIVTTPISIAGTLDDFAEDVAVQPSDGKIVATGDVDMGISGYDYGLARYDGATGSLDAGFDGDAAMPGFPGNGKVTTDFGSLGDDVPLAIGIQSDGKIVTAGYSDPAGSDTRDVSLARYNAADGTLDASFDGSGGAGNGRFTTTFASGSFDQASELAIGPGGKIVAVGAAFGPGTVDMALMRYAPANGALDASFSGDGKAAASLGAADGIEFYRGLAVMPDGRIVVGGTADVDPTAAQNLDFAIARFTAAGALDPAFSGDGKRTDPVKPGAETDVVNDLVLSGSRVLIAGYSGVAERDIALARYLPDTDDPATTVTRKPRRRTRDRTPTFRFTSDEPASTFMCKIDRKPFKPCSSPKTLRRLRLGKHVFSVRATDAPGNVDESAAKRRFRVIPR